MSDQWFVHSNDQEMGPYTGEQLVEYAQEGNITAETLVWAEGMPEWAPASQVEGLFPEAAAPVQGAASTSPETTDESSLNPQAVDNKYPFFPIKSASFGLWLWCLLGGFICFILALVVFTMSAKGALDAQAAGTDQDAAAAAAADSGKAVFGIVLMALGAFAMTLSMIFFYLNIYRAWKCLQAGAPRTSPGKAVGMLFIPFFNLYWIFVAIAGLPKDWNRIVASYDDLKTAPRLSETVFLLMCIGAFVPPLGLVMMFPMMSQICKGVNFFAYRRNPNAPSALGGFKFP
jgi:hypothetical protein